MTKEDYLLLQSQIVTLGSLVQDMPLEEMISMMNKADTVGPITDPTLWRQASPNMNRLREMARALLKFQGVVKKEKS